MPEMLSAWMTFAPETFRERRDRGHDGVAHLHGADLRAAFRPDVRRPQALGQHVLHRGLDPVGGLGLVEGKAEHHGGRQYCSQRIGNPLAGDVGRAAVDRLVQALAALVEHRRERLVGTDVELSWFADNRPALEAAFNTHIIVSDPRVIYNQPPQ